MQEGAVFPVEGNIVMQQWTEIFLARSVVSGTYVGEHLVSGGMSTCAINT